jgi:hypothetical protein
MMVYLREAIERRSGMEGIQSAEQIKDAVMEGAVARLRPKLLTEGTMILALIPMLWSTGVGSEFMKPMAAPILGGILVADEVIDILIPVCSSGTVLTAKRCRRRPQPAEGGPHENPAAARPALLVSRKQEAKPATQNAAPVETKDMVCGMMIPRRPRSSTRTRARTTTSARRLPGVQGRAEEVRN